MNKISALTEHTVAVYATHDLAEAAVKSLNSSGFNMKNLSIVGQNYATEEHPVGFINAGDRMYTWGKFGLFWGTVWGLLLGSAMVFVPGVGQVMFAGWIVGALEGAILGGGFAALGGALSSIGIPQDSVVKYEAELRAGSFLLVAHCSEAEIEDVKEFLTKTSTRFDTFSTEKPIPNS